MEKNQNTVIQTKQSSIWLGMITPKLIMPYVRQMSRKNRTNVLQINDQTIASPSRRQFGAEIVSQLTTMKNNQQLRKPL